MRKPPEPSSSKVTEFPQKTLITWEKTHTGALIQPGTRFQRPPTSRNTLTAEPTWAQGSSPALPYLSTLMMHKVMMEAVQHITSMAMNTLQNTFPKSHSPPTRSVMVTKGMTAKATDRSAAARDTTR